MPLHPQPPQPPLPQPPPPRQPPQSAPTLPLASVQQLRGSAGRLGQLKGRQVDAAALEELRCLIGAPGAGGGHRRDLLIVVRSSEVVGWRVLAPPSVVRCEQAPAALDPAAKIPEYKYCAVQVEAVGA